MYYEHVFVNDDVFAVAISFQSIYCQFFEQTSHFDLLLYVTSFVLSPEEATEVFFIKGIL